MFIGIKGHKLWDKVTPEWFDEGTFFITDEHLKTIELKSRNFRDVQAMHKEEHRVVARRVIATWLIMDRKSIPHLRYLREDVDSLRCITKGLAIPYH